MSNENLLHQIPYFEYSVINQIAHQHVEQLGARLRVVVVFGDIKTSDDAYDIDLLEVIEDWTAPSRFAEFRGDSTLPIRGTLRLWFLNPEEFEERSGMIGDEMHDWVQRLMEHVRKGYEVVYQVPAGYARNVLERNASITTLNAPGSGVLIMNNPFDLSVARK